MLIKVKNKTILEMEDIKEYPLTPSCNICDERSVKNSYGAKCKYKKDCHEYNYKHFKTDLYGLEMMCWSLAMESNEEITLKKGKVTRNFRYGKKNKNI